MDIQVIKRDGHLESFEPQKIFKVVKTAGLSEGEAQEVADTIDHWVKNLHKNKVSSMEIRDKVLEELKAKNEYVYNLFVWYENTKDKKS